MDGSAPSKERVDEEMRLKNALSSNSKAQQAVAEP
jgi:hypothetical protein